MKISLKGKSRDLQPSGNVLSSQIGGRNVEASDKGHSRKLETINGRDDETPLELFRRCFVSPEIASRLWEGHNFIQIIEPTLRFVEDLNKVRFGSCPNEAQLTDKNTDEKFICGAVLLAISLNHKFSSASVISGYQLDVLLKLLDAEVPITLMNCIQIDEVRNAVAEITNLRTIVSQEIVGRKLARVVVACEALCERNEAEGFADLYREAKRARESLEQLNLIDAGVMESEKEGDIYGLIKIALSMVKDRLRISVLTQFSATELTWLAKAEIPKIKHYDVDGEAMPLLIQRLSLLIQSNFSVGSQNDEVISKIWKMKHGIPAEAFISSTFGKGSN